MDEKRRVILRDEKSFCVPRDLREKLGWVLGNNIAVSPPKDGVITLRLHTIEPNSLHSSVIDGIGRITLSEETIEYLGWSKGDTLHLSAMPDGEAAIVTLYKKKIPVHKHPGRSFRSILPGDILR